VVLVVSAGNVSPPAVPHAPTEDDLRTGVREQLFSEDHALIDPACAVNALTVGAISRSAVPHTVSGIEDRPELVGSSPDCPAPFTRTGLLARNGTGLCRTVKPELVAYGGNLALLPQGRWRDNDPILGEPSLNHEFTQRLLKAACGTSVAAPFVTHVCALIEHHMRQLRGGNRISANLIRALAVHGALLPSAGEQSIRTGFSVAQARERILRVLGYGKPDPYRSCFSDNNRAVLWAEDDLPERCFHLYQFELPAEFLEQQGTRCIRVTLAYDPPVRGTRLEYMSRLMTMQLFRGVSDEQIRRALTETEGDATAVKLPDSSQRLKPQLFKWSTVQSAVCQSKKKTSFEKPADNKTDSSAWHVLVGCKHRFRTEQTETRQRYALVLSVEHSDDTVRLYEPLRLQVERLRARARVTGR
jgi:hypothetical protein